MIGGLAPVGDDGNVGLVFHPFFGHAGTEQDVINARVGIFHAVVVRPGFIAGGEPGIGGVGEVVAVLFGGAGVHEFVFAGTDDFLDAFGVVVVVEVAEDDEVGVRVLGEVFVHDAAEELGLTYAPRGTRSFGPVRALYYGGADYPAHADDTIVRFAMIETAQALDNLDAILSVEGLDAVYIGPSDLSLALGCKPAFDEVDPKVAQAIDHILARAQAHGLQAGIHNGAPEFALARSAKGFRFVTVSSDARILAAGSQQILGRMRAG